MCTSGTSQDIPFVGREHFENELAEEAKWVLAQSAMPCAFCFRPSRGLKSTPRKYPEEHARLNPAIYPSVYEMKIAVQELHKLHEPKINKLKNGYSATANFIFQSWLKDIRVHVEDWNLTEREAIQLVKDFTTERAHDEVACYMGMITNDQQTFDGLINYLKMHFSQGRL